MNDALQKFGLVGIVIAGLAAFVMFLVKWKIKSDKEAKDERAMMLDKIDKMADKHAEVVQEISDKHNKVVQEIADDYNKSTKENTSALTKIITLLETRPNNRK